MLKFLFKTAVTIGIAGLALEGVKKALEKKEEQEKKEDEVIFEEEYVTLSPSTPLQEDDQVVNSESFETVIESESQGTEQELSQDLSSEHSENEAE